MIGIWTDGSDLFAKHNDKWFRLFQWRNANWDGSKQIKTYGSNVTGGHPYHNLKASIVGKYLKIEATAYNAEGNYLSESFWTMEEVDVDPDYLSLFKDDTRPDYLKSPHLRLIPYYLGNSIALPNWMIKEIQRLQDLKDSLCFVSKDLSQIFIWETQILVSKNKKLRVLAPNIEGWYRTRLNTTNPHGGLIEVL